MNKNIKSDRQLEILKKLFAKKKVTFKELAKDLGASENIIKKDLEELKKIDPHIFKRSNGCLELVCRQHQYPHSTFSAPIDSAYTNASFYIQLS